MVVASGEKIVILEQKGKLFFLKYTTVQICDV